MSKPTKKPRHPANPDAPKFEPESWLIEGSKTEEHPNGLAISSNCYQYAISGSDKAGKNVIYDEAIPNPGESAGYVMTPHSYTKKKIAELASHDGVEIGSIDHQKLPPNKDGKYIVGIYIENLRTKSNPKGAQDFHFIRQDADGGWSEKQGLQSAALVQRYHEPAADGGYVTLPKLYGKNSTYKFAAYAYVPKEGIDGGIDAYLIPPILATLVYGPDSCVFPNSYFKLITDGKNIVDQDTSIKAARDIGKAMKKHGISEAVETYNSCLDAYVKNLRKPLKPSELQIDAR